MYRKLQHIIPVSLQPDFEFRGRLKPCQVQVRRCHQVTLCDTCLKRQITPFRLKLI